MVLTLLGAVLNTDAGGGWWLVKALNLRNPTSLTRSMSENTTSGAAVPKLNLASMRREELGREGWMGPSANGVLVALTRTQTHLNAGPYCLVALM